MAPPTTFCHCTSLGLLFGTVSFLVSLFFFLVPFQAAQSLNSQLIAAQCLAKSPSLMLHSRFTCVAAELEWAGFATPPGGSWPEPEVPPAPCGPAVPYDIWSLLEGSTALACYDRPDLNDAFAALEILRANVTVVPCYLDQSRCALIGTPDQSWGSTLALGILFLLAPFIWWILLVVYDRRTRRLQAAHQPLHDAPASETQA